MPVFPLMAISMAYVIWNAGETAQKITGALLLLTLFLKAAMTGYFCYRYIHLEPNYRNVAKDILRIVGNMLLSVDRCTCQSAPVEQVAIHLNYNAIPQKTTAICARISSEGKQIPICALIIKGMPRIMLL